MKQRPNRFHWINLLKEAFRGKEYDYTQGPLSKAIFFLTIPMVFEMLMEQKPIVIILSLKGLMYNFQITLRKMGKPLKQRLLLLKA